MLNICSMDEVDISILKELNKDARKSFRDIAATISVSPGTVYNRVERMEKDGVIKGYAPVVDPDKAGYTMVAVINLRISRGKLASAEEEISKDPRVFLVYDITGDWDAIVLGRFRDRADLNDFVKWAQTIKNIERTHTQVVLNVVKDDKHVVPLSSQHPTG